MTGRAGLAPPCATVGVAGLGLIGGSIALRIRATWPDVRVVGLDRRRVIQDAVRAGVIHDYVTAIGDLADCDIVFLAVPVPAILEFIDEAAAEHLTCVLTDVGSTKRLITAAAARVGLDRFVGGHPMAGSEHAGLTHARADLFEGRPWLLVGRAERADARDLVERLVRGLGAEPRAIDATAHDRFMAYVSHVPQLVASALMTSAGQRCGLPGLSASGPAFSEMTRVASSSFDTWRGTLATNADFVAEALEALIARLPSAPALREGGDLAALFAEAQRWRAEFLAAQARGGHAS
jgi:prephenate dehydrogenase